MPLASKRNQRAISMRAMALLTILAFIVFVFAVEIVRHEIKMSGTIARLDQCQVVRLYGAYNAINAYIGGDCYSAPKYVAYFNGTTTNYANYISVKATFDLNKSFTISFWMYPLRVGNGVNGSSYSEDIMDLYNNSTWLPQIYLEWRGNGNFNLNLCNSTVVPNRTPSVTCMEAWPDGYWLNHWVYVAETYDNGNYSIYINGTNVVANQGEYITNFYLIPPRIWFSYILPYNPDKFDSEFDGYLSNIQIYNTSLSASQIQYIYTHGIGSAPINIANLMGWWPLNGNAGDYSGNGNNGTVVNGG